MPPEILHRIEALPPRKRLQLVRRLSSEGDLVELIRHCPPDVVELAAAELSRRRRGLTQAPQGEE